MTIIKNLFCVEKLGIGQCRFEIAATLESFHLLLGKSFLRPDFLVNDFADEVKGDWDDACHEEESDSLLIVEKVEDRINPSTSEMFDNKNPADVSDDKNCDSHQLSFPAFVLMIVDEKLNHDEHENVGVKNVVEPPWVNRIHDTRQNKFTVNAVERPEHDRDVYTQRKSKRCENVISDFSNHRWIIWLSFICSNKVIDKSE